jgi:hypothetical protein
MQPAPPEQGFRAISMGANPLSRKVLFAQCSHTQIRREAIAKVNFPSFRGGQRQKWIQLTWEVVH